MAQQPKTYRAKERGYVDGRVIEANETFTTTAPKGEWMEPVKGTETPLQRAVAEALDPQPGDVDLTQLSKAALEALAADKGVNPKGLSKDDLITAIKAAYDKDRAQ